MGEEGYLIVVFSCLYGFFSCLQYRLLISTTAEVHNTVVAYMLVSWSSFARCNIFSVILHRLPRANRTGVIKPRKCDFEQTRHEEVQCSLG